MNTIKQYNPITQKHEYITPQILKSRKEHISCYNPRFTQSPSLAICSYSQDHKPSSISDMERLELYTKINNLEKKLEVVQTFVETKIAELEKHKHHTHFAFVENDIILNKSIEEYELVGNKTHDAHSDRTEFPSTT